MWVRGLKQPQGVASGAQAQSHPMWVRGLKLHSVLIVRCDQKSHPMWVRGLKQKQRILSMKPDRVAPHVGAWIET